LWPNSLEMSPLIKRFSVLATIIVTVAFSRVLPHPVNFSPLLAIALFGAAHFDWKYAGILVPIVATWLSDLYINNVIYASQGFAWFYEGCYWQYGAYFLVGLLGLGLLRSRINVTRTALSVVLASAIFFLASNFGVWATSSLYPQTGAGLTACYAAGLAYLQGTVVGTALYSTVLFGGYYFIQRQNNALKAAHVVYS
jgi:hypothetical protein